MKEEVDRILNFYSTSLSDRVIALTAPLKRCLGIDIFWHSQLTPEGLYQHVSNTPEGTIEYFLNHYYVNNPFLRHPKNYSEGIYFLSDLPLGPYAEAQQTYNQKYGTNHILYLCLYEGSLCHLFGFATSRKEPSMINIYLNHIPLLKKFVLHFLHQCKTYRNKLENFQIDLTKLVGPSFFTQNQFLLHPRMKEQHDFLKMLGIDFELLQTLTKREKECLQLFFKGKTAQQTASLLNISRRTVEYHFENIKDKLGCFSKAEIFEKYSSHQEFFHSPS